MVRNEEMTEREREIKLTLGVLAARVLEEGLDFLNFGRLMTKRLREALSQYNTSER